MSDPGAVATGSPKLGELPTMSEPGAVATGSPKLGALPTAKTTSNVDPARSKLARIVGEDHTFMSPLARAPKSVLTVVPGSIQEVSDVIKLAWSAYWTVMPAGGAP